MVSVLYYYNESERSDEKDNYYVDDAVKEDKENEQYEPIKQTIRPLILEFEDVNGSAHIKSFDWVLCHRNSCLTIELEVR
jgi:hypothetical protein